MGERLDSRIYEEPFYRAYSIRGLKINPDTEREVREQIIKYADEHTPHQTPPVIPTVRPSLVSRLLSKLGKK